MRAWLLLAVAVLFPAAGSRPQEETGTVHLHVSQRNGSDAGDGSFEKPFATIRRALALQAKRPDRRTEIHLQLGHYGSDTGESFPIRLPANVRLEGFGSKTCEIVAPPEQPVIELPSTGAVAIGKVALRGGTVGIAAVHGGDGAALEVALADVAIEGCATGVELAPASGRVALRADGLRVTKAATRGLSVAGAAELTLTLERSRFAQCKEGIVISTDGASPDGPFHALIVRDCAFEDDDETGFVRRGDDGRNRAPQPLLIESSRFERCRIGVALELPGGDVPFLIRDCDFVGNELFGASIVGSGSLLDGASRFERCRFRWNGVGMQLLTTGRPLELVDCRVEDSVGIGVNFGNWIGERSVLRAQRCLFAGNGAAGFFALTERDHGIDVTLEQCTVADNRGSGVERKLRKQGSGEVRLERCIVSGNAPDLVKVDAAETAQNCIGPDPHFVDRAGHDWRLRPDSPALADGVPRGALGGR